MTNRQHLRTLRVGVRSPQAHPSVGMRWLVLACALLFAVVTTAQAAHLHRPAAQRHSLQAPATATPNADNEEHCPLCVAMHPALPAPMYLAEEPVLLAGLAVPPSPDSGVDASWHFARFSRPPPVPSQA